jgi:hypothetical protein
VNRLLRCDLGELAECANVRDEVVTTSRLRTGEKEGGDGIQ